MQHEKLIAGYLAHAVAVAHDRHDAHFWAYEDLHELVEDNPQAAWPVVVEVVKRTTDEKNLGYVSADILEDMICEDPYGLVDRVEELARAEEHFRKALANVWGWSRMPTKIRVRLDCVVGRDTDEMKDGAG